MLALVLGLAGAAVGNAEPAAPMLSVRVGGYVPAACRAQNLDASVLASNAGPLPSGTAATCSALALIEVRLDEGSADASGAKVAHVTVTPL